MAWIAKYPEICTCVEDIAELVKIMRNHPNRDTCELEARFGSLSTKFKSGTSRSTMENIIVIMQESPHMLGDTEWQEEHDYYYIHNAMELRTRVTFNADNMEILTNTIHKTKIKNIDLKSSIGNDVRISLKKEIPLEEDTPTSVNTTFVRIKQKKQFRAKNSNFVFDFTMSWSGNTKDAAETSQQNDDPLFEIECELVDFSIFETKSDEYIAASLLLKMHDFLPNNCILSSGVVS